MIGSGLPEHVVLPQGAVMAVWVIYDHPHDFPDGYVLRPQFVMRAGTPEIGAQAWYANDPNELRAIVPRDTVRLQRSVGDDPAIMETWL